MHFKLIIAFVEDTKTHKIMEAARQAGATGATIVGDARGEGLMPRKTFLGLTMELARDMVLFLVEEHLSRHILERIAEVAEFETQPGCGIAFQLDVEDVVGLKKQIETIMPSLEEKI